MLAGRRQTAGAALPNTPRTSCAAAAAPVVVGGAAVDAAPPLPPSPQRYTQARSTRVSEGLQWKGALGGAATRWRGPPGGAAAARPVTPTPQPRGFTRGSPVLKTRSFIRLVVAVAATGGAVAYFLSDIHPTCGCGFQSAAGCPPHSIRATRASRPVCTSAQATTITFSTRKAPRMAATATSL